MSATMRVIPIAEKRDWLAIRRPGSGPRRRRPSWASTPISRRLDLYAQKLGLLEGPDETEAMYFGKKLEPVLAEVYEERTGRPVFNPGPLHDRPLRGASDADRHA